MKEMLINAETEAETLREAMRNGCDEIRAAADRYSAVLTRISAIHDCIAITHEVHTRQEVIVAIHDLMHASNKVICSLAKNVRTAPSEEDREDAQGELDAERNYYGTVVDVYLNTQAA